ncbi:MAG TPA: sigma factor-like helix-turn-helix DNA-binding protein, partial [Solirubrobacteraceae bacterium]|nr:sigma factor-like helix-turn-helix DNA-binding protein [Solirubrobacteraceae bacterium]
MTDAELVDRHLGPLLGYARMVAPDPGHAAAAVERAFAEVLGGDPPRDPRRELLLAVRRELFDEPLDGPVEEADALRAASFALPPAQREVLALRELHGMSCDEIAAVTGLSPLAVAQLAWRGFGRLRSLVCGEPGGVSLRSRDCERALTLTTLAEDAPLPDEVATTLRRHVATCPPCQVSPVAIADARTRYREGARARGEEEVRERVLAAAAAAPRRETGAASEATPLAAKAAAAAAAPFVASGVASLAAPVSRRGA